MFGGPGEEWRLVPPDYRLCVASADNMQQGVQKTNAAQLIRRLFFVSLQSFVPARPGFACHVA